MSTITSRGGRPWGRRARHVLSAVGFAAATAVALAPAASAAPGQTSADGLTCTGLVTCTGLAHSEYPAGPPSATVAGATITGLPAASSTGVINTAASSTGASSSVANVALTLATLTTLNATTVSSSCSIDPNTGAVSGSAAIAGGQLSILGTTTNLAATPGANSGVSVPGVATITLNRQSTAPDGTLTVDAIYISFLNSAQTITIATSTCGVPSNAVPVIAPAFAAGTGAVAAVGLPFAVIWYRRRSALAAQTA